MTKICMAGVTGWTGKAVAAGILDAADLELTGALARKAAGLDVGDALGRAPVGVTITADVGEALAGADAAVVTEVCGAREDPVPGVTGRLVLDRLAELRPGMPIAWAPGFDDVAAVVRALARPGDLVVTHGCGDIYRAIPGILERLRT